MTMRIDRLVLLVAAAGIATAPAGAADVQWNVASGNYSNPANWDPFGVPGTSDRVYFGQAVPDATGAINIDADVDWIVVDNETNIIVFDPAVTVTANYLGIQENASLYVVGLTDDGAPADLDLSEISGFGAWIYGTLFLQNAYVVADGLNDSQAGTGLIEGHGLFIAQRGGQFTGTIRAEGGTLEVRLFGPFYLDGTTAEDATLEALAGAELIIRGSLTDPYSGTVDVAPGGRIEFRDVEVDTFVQITGTATERAELEIYRLVPGGSVWASGGLCGFEGYLESGTSLDINVTADTEARFTAEEGADIDVDGVLRLANGTTELGPVTVTGIGTIQGLPGSTLRVAQPLQVPACPEPGASNTTIDLPIVELGDTLVLGGACLTVNTNQITLGDPATDGFAGEFRNFGRTTINTLGSWRMGGTFEFDGSLEQPSLHGSPMVVTDGGVVRSVDSAGGRITSTFQMLDGASIELDEGVLRLDGTTFFDGGTVSGAGTLVQNADAFVDGTVVIDPAWYVWDVPTAPTIDVGATGDLTIDARGLEGRQGIIRNRGALDVTNRDGGGNPVGWTTLGLIRAHGGSSLSGTELTLDGGILELVPDNGPVAVNAPLRVENGGQIQMSSFGAPLTLNGATTLVGTFGTPTITGDGDLTMTGDLDVFDNAHIDCALFDWDGIGSVSTTTVHANASLLVELDNFSILFGFDKMGGTINLEGGSSLRVLKSDPEWVLSGLLSLDNATVAQSTRLRCTGRVEGEGGFYFAPLDNAGTLAPTGTIFFTDTSYEQLANGTLEIQIAGSSPGNDYGRLAAGGFFGGTVTLDGTLQVELTGGYVPTIGAIFEIVDADAVNGTFSTVDAPGFTVTYLSDKVLLSFIGLPCENDLNGDDAIGFGDLTQLLSAWGVCPGCPEDLDGNGAVGFSDLTTLLNVWGSCP